MKNPYAITQKEDGWWIAVSELGETRTIGKPFPSQVDAVMKSLDLFAEELTWEVEEIKTNPKHANELVAGGYVDVIVESTEDVFVERGFYAAKCLFCGDEIRTEEEHTPEGGERADKAIESIGWVYIADGDWECSKCSSRQSLNAYSKKDGLL